MFACVVVAWLLGVSPVVLVLVVFCSVAIYLPSLCRACSDGCLLVCLFVCLFVCVFVCLLVCKLMECYSLQDSNAATACKTAMLRITDEESTPPGISESCCTLQKQYLSVKLATMASLLSLFVCVVG